MIRWAEIEAECGNYRDGFVNVFRRHEGQATDEKDGQGRTVKVTATSFARHMGIAESTFRGWTRSASVALQPPARQRLDTSRARTALRDAPMEQIEQIISELPKERQELIRAAAGSEHARARRQMREQEGRTSRGEREARRGEIRDMTERMLSGFSVASIINHLEQATEDLGHMVEARALTRDQFDQVNEATLKWLRELEVAGALLGLEVES